MQGRYLPFARAAAAELAVAAGLPSAPQRTAAAQDADDPWNAAVLERASGRLAGDAEAVRRAARRWADLGARFEEAATLRLLRP
ncbi:hypothetical protein ACQEVB_38095 [Pseudonocardia sp. CA-107938]|uniref:hypothetical protein n=1 Tax=Pseudonocardia sp. CA-107938 TaxID=3240021 RepID=UPI003D8F0491